LTTSFTLRSLDVLGIVLGNIVLGRLLTGVEWLSLVLTG
jgi:hypothetical protein